MATPDTEEAEPLLVDDIKPPGHRSSHIGGKRSDAAQKLKWVVTTGSFVVLCGVFANTRITGKTPDAG